MTNTVNHSDTGSVNRVPVPDPSDERWLVLMCTTKWLRDPETDECWGIEYTLEHAISPKTGASASAQDPDKLADHRTTRDCVRQVNYRIEEGELGDMWAVDTVEPGFAADGEMYVHIIGCQPEPISHGRPAQVRWRR